jgi:hypothetical protein
LGFGESPQRASGPKNPNSGALILFLIRPAEKENDQEKEDAAGRCAGDATPIYG